jgi:site-specific DNA-methyltransferase (adenine-specific)
MIIWDKMRRGMDQADCEIAWTNLPGQSRIFEFRWNGMLQGDMQNKETRIHPTQKPVALYRWIFQHYAKSGFKILDTHLGSGSSRIAAYDAGLDFWGYELDKVYFDLMQARFDKHAAQMNLFLDA